MFSFKSTTFSDDVVRNRAERWQKQRYETEEDGDGIVGKGRSPEPSRTPVTRPSCWFVGNSRLLWLPYTGKSIYAKTILIIIFQIFVSEDQLARTFDMGVGPTPQSRTPQEPFRCPHFGAWILQKFLLLWTMRCAIPQQEPSHQMWTQVISILSTFPNVSYYIH